MTLTQDRSGGPWIVSPHAPRLIPRVVAALRVRHYSPRTVAAYVAWIRRFVRFHGLEHPITLGAADVGAFLSDLATTWRVSASTQSQAYAALAFLYREVLEQPLGSAPNLVRAKRSRRQPVVLTPSKVGAVLG